MKTVIGGATAILVMLLALAQPHGAEGTIVVVAAENFYGDVAQQIGGARVAVTSILNNPAQDPHLFEVTPTVVRRVAAAQVVIYNGADYDPWIEALLNAAPRPGRVAIAAADLMHKKPGADPHLWYDPQAMPALAKALAAALGGIDAAHADGYAARLKAFVASLQPLDDKVVAIRGKFAGAPVTATEPIFGYMAAALRLRMLNQGFQLAVMNDTEPSAGDLAAFERDLKTHRVRAMFYNRQVSDKLVRHLVDLARACNIPVVGVTETVPPGLSYQAWMLRQLDATARALAGQSS